MAEFATNYVTLATAVVVSYVSNNPVKTSDLSTLIVNVYSSLSNLGLPKTEEPTVEIKPAVPIKKSVTPDYLICLEDGKKFRSLKRHLRAHYEMSPEQYRAKWGLPSNYPMAAPNYAAARSELAKRIGLGQRPRKAVTGPAPAIAKLGRAKA